MGVGEEQSCKHSICVLFYLKRGGGGCQSIFSSTGSRFRVTSEFSKINYLGIFDQHKFQMLQIFFREGGRGQNWKMEMGRGG